MHHSPKSWKASKIPISSKFLYMFLYIVVINPVLERVLTGFEPATLQLDVLQTYLVTCEKSLFLFYSNSKKLQSKEIKIFAWFCYTFCFLSPETTTNLSHTVQGLGFTWCAYLKYKLLLPLSIARPTGSEPQGIASSNLHSPQITQVILMCPKA